MSCAAAAPESGVMRGRALHHQLWGSILQGRASESRQRGRRSSRCLMLIQPAALMGGATGAELSPSSAPLWSGAACWQGMPTTVAYGFEMQGGMPLGTGWRCGTASSSRPEPRRRGTVLRPPPPRERPSPSGFTAQARLLPCPAKNTDGTAGGIHPVAVRYKYPRVDGEHGGGTVMMVDVERAGC